MRNLIIAFLFLFVSLLVLTIFVGVTKVNPKPILKTYHPHMYGNDKASIEKISLTVFYFIPKDATSSRFSNWEEVTNEHLKELLSFHSLLFEDASKITYKFFPKIIVGEKTTKEYESILNNNNDSDALIPIKDEINRRVYTKDGDLYTQEKNTDTNIREVNLVVFEGDGAAGNDDFCLVSRNYLSDSIHKDYGSTFLSHEFYHTLGIPDHYQQSVFVYKDNEQVPVSLVTEKDIMGQVNIPLPYTYINTDTLKKMGM